MIFALLIPFWPFLSALLAQMDSTCPPLQIIALLVLTTVKFAKIKMLVFHVLKVFISLL